MVQTEIIQIFISFIQSIPILLLFQIEKSSNLSMHARVLPEKENIPSILRENRMY